MTLDLDALTGLLERDAAVDEFVVVERRDEWARLRGIEPARAASLDGDGRVLEATLYRDARHGRGSVRLRIGNHVDDPKPLIRDALRQAERSLEPTWSLPPPAAPARVDVSDAAIGEDLVEPAEAIRKDIAERMAKGGVLADQAGMPVRAGDADIAVRRRQIAIVTSRGFSHRYEATSVEVAISLTPVPGPRGVAERIEIRSRRLADLELSAALEQAARRLRDRHRARPLPPGRYDLVLTEDAITPTAIATVGAGHIDWSDGLDAESGLDSDARFGWFAPLVAQADARRARYGLTLYQPGQSIFAHSRSDGDPLSVVSDGTIPFAQLSQPVGPLGEPVRRFPIVDRGVAAGLALNLREAALRGSIANGGVRNLRISPGSATTAALLTPGPRPLLEAVRLGALEVAPASGAFAATLDLGYVTGAGTSRQAVTGGTLQGNIFELLSRSRLASEVALSGWYQGPRAIHFSNVAIS